MQITKEQLLAIMPKAATHNLVENLPQYINTTLGEFGISDIKDVAAFLATLAVESAQLTTYVENLNYSADALLKVFPKYFDKDTAKAYARQPQKIANRVYGGRMGNGGEQSGEGWLHRGAGAIQLTGKNNQLACSRYFNVPLDEIGSWLQTDKGAIRSAGWFWKTNSLSKLNGDIVEVTKKVNGGSTGLGERKKFYETALSVLGGNDGF